MLRTRLNRFAAMCLILILTAENQISAAENQVALLQDEEDPCSLPPWLRPQSSGSGSRTNTDDLTKSNNQPFGIDCDENSVSSDRSHSTSGSVDMSVEDDDCINGSPLPQPIDDKSKKDTTPRGPNDLDDDDCINGSPLPQPLDVHDVTNTSARGSNAPNDSDDDDCINGSPLPQPVDCNYKSSHGSNTGYIANSGDDDDSNSGFSLPQPLDNQGDGIMDDDDCIYGSPLPQPFDSSDGGSSNRGQNDDIVDDDCIDLPLPQPADSTNTGADTHNGPTTAGADGNGVNVVGKSNPSNDSGQSNSSNQSSQTPIASTSGTYGRLASSPEPNGGNAAVTSTPIDSAAPRSAPTNSPAITDPGATTTASSNAPSHLPGDLGVSGSLRGSSSPQSTIPNNSKGRAPSGGSSGRDEAPSVATGDPISTTPANTPQYPSSSKTSEPTTAPPPQQAPISSNLFLRMPLSPICPGDATPVSVEGVEGIFCVPGFYICASDRSNGACPDRQQGLLDGSHCGIVRTGVHGCKPGPRPQRVAQEPNCRQQGLEPVSVAGVGTFCSEKPVCAGTVFGKCPQAQFGLSFPSHCQLVSRGVYGCAA